MTDLPIVVIGGGFAGLAAAVRLVQAGRRVIVLEARPRLGGRTTAFPDKVSGVLVDNGQHVLFGCYRETLDLLRTIGAEDRVRVQPALDVAFVDARERHTRLRCPDLPAPFHLIGGLLDWDALRWRDRWAALRVWRAVNRGQSHLFGRKGGQSHFFSPETDKWDCPPSGWSAVPRGISGTVPLSVRDWLLGLRQPGRLRQFLWEPLAIAALNEPPELASAEAFAEVLQLLFADGPRNSGLVMPIVPLDEMYAVPARAFIESRGSTVRLNALAKVVATADGVTAVRVGNEDVPCAAVISTVPWNLFGNLFDKTPPALSDVAATAARMASRPIVTANLWFDRPVLDDPFVGLPGCTVQWAFEKGDASHLSCIVSGAIELVDRSNEEILEIAAADVKDRLARARGAALVRGTVVRERHATFSSAQPEIQRPAATTPLRGFYLAGDWIDTGLPSTIEGAVRSARLAVAALTYNEKRGREPFYET